MMTVVYEVNILLVISLTLPNFLQANHGTLSSNLGQLSQSDSIFPSAQTTNTVIHVSDPYISEQSIPYRNTIGDETDRIKAAVAMLRRHLYEQPLKPYHQVRNFKMHTRDNFIETWHVAPPIQWRTQPVVSLQSVPSHERRQWWTREIQQDSVNIDNQYQNINKRNAFIVHKRPSALSPPARDWCRLMGYRVCPRAAGA